MKLLILGVFTRESTCVGFARGLRRAGARVQELCFGQAMSPSAPEHLRVMRQLRHLLRTFTPDKVLLMKGMFLSIEEIQALAAEVHTVYVTFDTITIGPPGRVESLGGRARECHEAIATGSEAVEWLRAQGLPTLQMFQGFRPEIWKPDPTTRPARRLGFLGHTYPGDGGRAQKLDQIRRAGIPVETAGYPSPLLLEEAVTFNSGCAAVLNFVPGRSPGSFSNRVIRALATGTPVISEWCRDLEEHFSGVPGLHLWKTTEELLGFCRAAISEPPGARDRTEIARWAHTHQTWDHQGALAYEFLTGELAETEARGSDRDFLLQQAELAQADGLPDTATRFRAIAERI